MTLDEKWQIKLDLLDDKYFLLLRNWKQLLVKLSVQEKHILEQDKVIVALQERIRNLTIK